MPHRHGGHQRGLASGKSLCSSSRFSPRPADVVQRHCLQRRGDRCAPGSRPTSEQCRHNGDAMVPDAQVQEFVEHVVAAATADFQDGAKASVLIDVYCGVGLFAVACSAKVNKVFGIELDKTAIGLAKRNAITRGLENTSFMAADAGDGLAWVSRELGATAATGASVIVDPPRQGLAKGARAALLAWRPRRVVYVSCDPGTQARDLQDFVTAGYTLTRVTPFDLFPQTRHLEAVAVLDRRVLD
eukprot:TRINITY_DN8784_c0_g1_i2.p1 TRINITY_DN8784_c0_g1~~TRINITY_DN8784_c0_g1_i2.p1  ORF type:complete len:243 (+),score=29.32 TRINITY_DN8784_c0_g1_i2:138-866(+)